MREMTSAEFAKIVNTLEEPVALRRYATVIGVYYPTGTAPDQGAEIEKLIEENAALHERVLGLTGELVAAKKETYARLPRIVDPSFGHSRPAPKPGKK